MTELDVYQPGSLVPADDEWSKLNSIAASVAKTEFVPQGLRNRPEAVLAAILAGRELGIAPMRSLEHISIIEGKPNFSAELMLSKIRESGHSVTVAEHTDKKVTVVGKRRDTGDVHTVTWRIEDAQNANLLGKSNWKNYPRTMLTWRAVTDLARFLFPDVMGGLIRYTDDELGADTEPVAVVVDEETGEIEVEDSAATTIEPVENAAEAEAVPVMDADAEPGVMDEGAPGDEGDGAGSLPAAEQPAPNPSNELYDRMMELARAQEISLVRLLSSAKASFDPERQGVGEVPIGSLQDLRADEMQRVIAALSQAGEVAA